MIKANELRIGNLIWCLHEESESVKTVDIGVIEDFIYHEQDPDDSDDRFARFGFRYAPIPLTEQWLLNFGFEKDDKGEYWMGDSFLIFNEDGHWDFRISYKYEYYIQVKYVHRLQNLYYEIGQELTLKQPI